MPNMKVVIEVEAHIWEVLPDIARQLKLPSDARNADTASEIFNTLAEFSYMDTIANPNHTVGFGVHNDALQTLNEILDPSIAKEVVVSTMQGLMAVGKSLDEWFEDYHAADPSDPWITKVLGMPAEVDTMLWRLALASVYQVIRDPLERRSTTTWQLIEKTYHLMKKNVDNSPAPGDNGAVASSNDTVPKP